VIVIIFVELETFFTSVCMINIKLILYFIYYKMSNPCTNTQFNYLKADNSKGSCYVDLRDCHGDLFSIYFSEPMSFSSGTDRVWTLKYDFMTNSYIQNSPVPSDEKGYMIAYFLSDHDPSVITLCHSSTPHVAECTLTAKPRSYETAFFSSTGIF
jgi:hypothetical protein